MKQDERLSTLMAYAKELADAPQQQKLTVFLSIQKKAHEEHISFTPEERSILLKELTAHMTEEEKRRVDMIQTLAAKLGH